MEADSINCQSSSEQKAKGSLRAEDSSSPSPRCSVLRATLKLQEKENLLVSKLNEENRKFIKLGSGEENGEDFCQE